MGNASSYGVILGAIVGSAVGAPGVGAAVGGFLGGLADQAAMPKIKGPKLDDLRIMTASEGSPIPYSIGPENRVAGVVFWADDKVQHKHKKGSDKGTYWYSCSFAVAINVGEIQGINKIWANSTLIYDDTPGVDISSTQISATVRIDPREPTTGRRIARLESPNGGPDLSDIRTGAKATIGGFTDTNLNGLKFCIATNFDSSTGESWADFEVLVPAADEAAGNTITITQAPQNLAKGTADRVTVYTGTSSQTASTFIEGIEPANTVPGFRNIAYILFENMNLEPYGNSIPNLNFLVEVDTSLTLQAAVSGFLDRAGLSSGDYDVSGLTGSVTGYPIQNTATTIDALSPLLIAYDIVVTEMDGKLYFTHRTDTDLIEIAADDVATHELGSSVDRPFSLADRSSMQLPSEVVVKYIDPEYDYQEAEQRESLINYTAENIVQIDLPIVMSADTARGIAKRLLWIPWSNRQSVELFLPAKYLHITENDRIQVVAESETYQILVLSVERGNNNIIRIEGEIEQLQTASQSSSAPDYDGTDSDIYVAPALILYIIDIPAISQSELEISGYYYAVCVADRGKSFTTSQLYESSDDSTFDVVSVLYGAAIMGNATDALADASHYYWDRGNVVTVELYNGGTLSSSTEIDVMNGANQALLGDEIIGFVTATLVDTNTYELSGLLRGRRNTENYTSTHVLGERFVLLNDGIGFNSIPAADIDKTKYFKAIQEDVADDIDDYISIEADLGGQTIHPFAPCSVAAVRDGSNNLTITWERRTRDFIRLFGAHTAVPTYEGTEIYEIDIYDGATVVRTITGDDNKSEGYSAAEQTSDGLTPGDPVKMRLYQISESVGRGNYQEVTI